MAGVLARDTNYRAALGAGLIVALEVLQYFSGNMESSPDTGELVLTIPS